MIKTIRTNEARKLGVDLANIWEESRKDIKVNGKTLYNIIGLRKEIERISDQIQDTLITLTMQGGGVLQENGAYKVPDEEIVATNERLSAFAHEPIDINFSEIHIGADEFLPTDILDVLYDFVEMEF